MNCNDYKKHFLLYLDGELHPDLANNITKHVESCESCSIELHRMMEVYKIIEEEKNDYQPNLTLSANVIEKVKNKHARSISNNLSIRYLFTASLAAAGLALGIIIGSLYTTEPNTQENSETAQVWDQLANDYMPDIDDNPYTIVVNNNDLTEKP